METTTMITFRKIGPGIWGLQSDTELTPGETVAVTTRAGGRKQVTVGNYVNFQGGRYLYRVTASKLLDAPILVENS